MVWRDCMPGSNWIDDCRPRWLIVLGKYKLLGRCNSFSRKFPFYRFIGLYSLQIAMKTFIIQVYYHYGRNFQFLSKNYEAPSKIVEIKIKYIELLRIKSLNIESKVIKDLIQFIWSKFYELKVKKRPHNFWTTFGNSYLCYPHNCENFYNSSLLCDEGWRELLWSMRKCFVT